MNQNSSSKKSDAWQSAGLNQARPQEDELIKNQWIPFASTTVFLLLMAIVVAFVGNQAVRSTEPIAPTMVAPTIPASPTLIPPTATDTPSPTVVPATPQPLTVRVLPNSANVRAAPSTTAKIIGQIKKGSLTTPLVRSEDGRWFLVVSSESGLTGWVANELFEIISGDPKTLPTLAPIPP